MEIKTKGFEMPNGDVHVFMPPSPTETERGGIKAKPKTTETVEVTIGEDGKLYVPKCVEVEEFDDAVKTSLTNSEADPWTSEEQSAAQNLLGVTDKFNAVNILLNGLTTTKQQPEYLSQLADSGMFGEVYNAGDQFITTWTDTQASKTYEYPFRLNHIGDVELEDGTLLTKRPYLQAHYAHPFGVQFSHQRAFLRCPDGLSAGTYYFTIETKWGGNVSAGDVVCFTLTKDIPVGGRLSGCYGAPDQNKSNWRIYSHSADGKTILETVIPTFEANGIDLGIQKNNSRNGDLNSTQEMAYGWNRWSKSALRQYLNSDAGVGEWWTAQDEWDIAPDQLIQKAGFLTGLPSDLLSVMKTVKVITYANTVNDGGVEDVTYDKVFIPSLEQIFVTPQIAGEGEYHEYWKKRSGSANSLAQYSTNTNMITYAVENHTSPQRVRLRSAYRGYAYDTWYVFSSGFVGSDCAINAYRFSPLIII